MDTSSGTTNSLYLCKASWKDDLTVAAKSGDGPGGGTMHGGPIVAGLLAEVAGGVDSGAGSGGCGGGTPVMKADAQWVSQISL